MRDDAVPCQFPIPPLSDKGIRIEVEIDLVAECETECNMLELRIKGMRISDTDIQIGLNGIHNFSHIATYTELLVRTVGHLPSVNGLRTHEIVPTDQVWFVLGVDDVQSAPERMERITIIEV